MPSVSESVTTHPEWYIHRFKPSDGLAEALRKGEISLSDAISSPSFLSSERIEGNKTLTEGFSNIIDVLFLGLGTPWDSAHSYLGVGDSLEAENDSQNGLLGLHKVYSPVSNGYPLRYNAYTVEFMAVFDGDTANFAWTEFTLANGQNDSYANFNRKVDDRGTKREGEVWTLVLRLGFANPS